MKKPTEAVSLQTPLLAMEYIKDTVCRKGVCLASPQRENKKITEVFTFFRSDPWQGHRRVR